MKRSVWFYWAIILFVLISFGNAIAAENTETKGSEGYQEFDLGEGVPPADLLNKAGIGTDLNAVFLVSAPGGYRSLLSCGELLL